MGLGIQIALTFTLADKAERSHDEGGNSQVYTDKAGIQVILDMKSVMGEIRILKSTRMSHLA